MGHVTRKNNGGYRAGIPTVIFSDRDILIVNKPAGMAVEGVEKSGAAIFAQWVTTLSGKTSSKAGSKTGSGPGDIKATRCPGLVHRLDKDTSGIMVIAKTKKALENLKQQFKQRAVTKSYQALVVGRLSSPVGRIEAPLIMKHRIKGRVRVGSLDGAKEAYTDYQVEKNLGAFTLLKLHPLTGRTHQIRVHLLAIGHPILGDPIYGSRRWNRRARERFGLTRPFLHADGISFLHPRTKEMCSFSAPLAAELQLALDAIK